MIGHFAGIFIKVVPHSLGHTNVDAVEAQTPILIVKELHKNFNPLPAFSNTPINIENLSKELIYHPDRQLVNKTQISDHIIEEFKS